MVTGSVPPALTVDAPDRVRAGETAVLIFGGAGDPQVEVRDPAGRLVRAYSGNVRVGWPQPWRIPFAINDTPGRWTVTVLDALGGARIERGLELMAP